MKHFYILDAIFRNVFLLKESTSFNLDSKWFTPIFPRSSEVRNIKRIILQHYPKSSSDSRDLRLVLFFPRTYSWEFLVQFARYLFQKHNLFLTFRSGGKLTPLHSIHVFPCCFYMNFSFFLILILYMYM